MTSTGRWLLGRTRYENRAITTTGGWSPQRPIGARSKPIDDFTFNNDEKQAYKVIADHVDRAWEAETGHPPTDDERRELLRQCHLLILDVDPDGTDESAARQLLRSEVLSDPDVGDAAWATLIELGARLAADRTGTDLPQLQSYLVSQGFKLKTLVDFRADVARLTDASSAALRRLESGAIRIPSPDGGIDVGRPAIATLVDRSAQGHVLVVGDPGSGKSVALHHLADHELTAGAHVLFLPVDSLAAASVGELRNEFGLDHDFLRVLSQWAPGEPKLLIVDALDAARSDPQADLWRSIITVIQEHQPEWRIAASVRAWDLRHSIHLPGLFPGDAVRLDDLDDGELQQVADAWPALADLVSSASQDLHQLLRSPFNLRLAAELLLLGDSIQELQTIDTRLDLLDRYWAHRVTEGQNGGGRQALLTSICDFARTHRSLTVPTAPILTGDATAGVLMASLLSNSVLADASVVPSAVPASVRFSHNVLFDYAVAVTTFNADDDAVQRLLEADPDSILFARPSIDMHLERLWAFDVGRFWKMAIAIAENDALPNLALVAVADVAARRAKAVNDLDSLLDPILADAGTPAAHRLLRYLVLAAAIDGQDEGKVDTGLWAAVAERLAKNVGKTEQPLRFLLDELTRGTDLAAEDIRLCGVAARRLLDFSWNLPPSGANRFAIEAVLATASSDPAETESLLRRALEPNRLVSHGAEDLLWLCGDVSTLALSMPGFVEDLYGAVMPYAEESQETTRMGGGLILSLTSTRRQDVDLAKHRLVDQFPSILGGAPVQALNVLAALHQETDQPEPLEGAMAGSVASILPSDTARWDHRDRGDDSNIPSLLNAFEDHLANLTDEARIDLWLERLSATAIPMVIWRRVLEAASRNERLAQRFTNLAELVTYWAPTDLAEPLATLLRVRFPTLDDDERRSVEEAITKLDPGPCDETSAWYAADHRHLLFLHSLDANSLVTEEAAEAQATSVAPEPRQRFSMGSFEQEGEDTPGRYGLRFESESDRKAWALIEPLKRFTDEFFNDSPDSEGVESSLALVLALLSSPLFADLSGPMATFTERTIARAAEIWCRCSHDVGRPALDLAKSLLMDFRDHPEPAPRPERETGRLISIPGGPRTDAAHGLLLMARFADCLDGDLLDAITAFSTDPVPWIRLQTARELYLLRSTAPDFMWDLLGRIAMDEPHDGVLVGVARCAYELRADLDQAVRVLGEVATRVAPTGHRESALEMTTKAAGLLWVFFGHQGALDVLTRLSDTSTYGADALGSLLHHLRKQGAFTSDDDAVRVRTLDLCRGLLDDALTTLGNLDEPDPGAERLASLKTAAKMFDRVGFQLYAATGALEDRREKGQHRATPEEARLVREGEDLIERLAGVPIPGVTHHVAEILKHMLDDEPTMALLTLRMVILGGGRGGGYQFEPMGEDLAVEIVQRILADHRGILRDPECLTALREVLDIFVEAGSSKAHRIAYTLEQIFR